jgi:hypothetical protein
MVSAIINGGDDTNDDGDDAAGEPSLTSLDGTTVTVAAADGNVGDEVE